MSAFTVLPTGIERTAPVKALFTWIQKFHLDPKSFTWIQKVLPGSKKFYMDQKSFTKIQQVSPKRSKIWGKNCQDLKNSKKILPEPHLFHPDLNSVETNYKALPFGGHWQNSGGC